MACRPRADSGNAIHARSQSSAFASSWMSAGAAIQTPVNRFVMFEMKSASAAGYSPPPGM